MSLDLKSVEELGSLLSEPEWLRGQRREAFQLFERMGYPSREQEEWRRTSLQGLNLEGFAPFDLDSLQQWTSGPVQVELSEELRRQGVVLLPLSQAAREYPDLIEGRLFSSAVPSRDKLAALHAAYFSGGTFLYVPAGVQIEQPLGSRFWSSEGALTLPHTLIVAGAGSSFNYFDEFLSPPREGVEGVTERAAYCSGSVEIFAEEASHVGYVALQRWGDQVWQFADQRVRAGRDATVQMINVGLGGRFSKHRVEADLIGRGANVELKGMYFGGGQQFFDYHTLQRHLVGDTTSDLLFKGALTDQSQAVYAGLIRIEPQAAHSNAYQADRNLLLSTQARAHSIPMLEIHNNDVRCTHGATVAPLDPEHLFYLESRGIPPATAEQMIVRGFFGEVLDRIPIPQIQETVLSELEARIG